MTPELIINGGIFVCVVAVVGAIIAAILLHIAKSRLNKKLDAEYGKRRH